MPMSLSMALLHSIGQENQSIVQHYIFDHVMPLVLESASQDANDIINGTISR